ncbi:MAG: hypothetical protein A3F16_00870 [Deltaproteobacteria bacterium RIFCSPHIGHO2_12_FULL_43_9]|nr:MAG: hypothetical protein A3F16_00870 [Deltaproteobacteria bacterium RIFCSPHIGHO2_12_FULL_43_9]
MGNANIKIATDEIKKLKSLTGEKTGQKAVNKALKFFFRAARQRNAIKLLQEIEFHKGFNPLRLRRHDR